MRKVFKTAYQKNNAIPFIGLRLGLGQVRLGLGQVRQGGWAWSGVGAGLSAAARFDRTNALTEGTGESNTAICEVRPTKTEQHTLEKVKK